MTIHYSHNTHIPASHTHVCNTYAHTPTCTHAHTHVHACTHSHPDTYTTLYTNWKCFAQVFDCHCFPPTVMHHLSQVELKLRKEQKEISNCVYMTLSNLSCNHVLLPAIFSSTAETAMSSSSFGRLVLFNLLFSCWRGGEYLRRGLVILVSPCSVGVADTSLKRQNKIPIIKVPINVKLTLAMSRL